MGNTVKKTKFPINIFNSIKAISKKVIIPHKKSKNISLETKKGEYLVKVNINILKNELFCEYIKNKQGLIKRGILTRDLTLGNFTFKKATVIYFHTNGLPAKGILAKKYNSGELTFKKDTEIILDKKNNPKKRK